MDSDKAKVHLIEPREEIEDSGMEFPAVNQIISPVYKPIISENFEYP